MKTEIIKMTNENEKLRSMICDLEDVIRDKEDKIEELEDEIIELEGLLDENKSNINISVSNCISRNNIKVQSVVDEMKIDLLFDAFKKYSYDELQRRLI